MADLSTLGTLTPHPVRDRPDLLATPVRDALDRWPHAAAVGVAPIDPDLADTAALVEATGVPAEASANCVVVAGRREGVERIAACVLLATTRADVNSTVRRLLGVRKASFLTMDRAVAESGMAHGGITPVGLPDDWALLVDDRVPAVPLLCLGSGVRHSKLLLPGALLTRLPRAQLVPALALPR